MGYEYTLTVADAQLTTNLLFVWNELLRAPIEEHKTCSLRRSIMSMGLDYLGREIINSATSTRNLRPQGGCVRRTF